MSVTMASREGAAAGDLETNPESPTLALLAMIWRTGRLLTFLYLTYGCMYLAPKPSLRRWGAATWWWLSQRSPESLWLED